MNIQKFRTGINTIVHLKTSQLFYQVYYRLVKHKMRYLNRGSQTLKSLPFIDKRHCALGGIMSFLNISDDFIGWNDMRHGALWAYNLNYMDWLHQPDMTADEGSEWINDFIDNIDNNKIGLAPYPTALRGINWIKFISNNHGVIDPIKMHRYNNSLYSQYDLLYRRLEYHLLGNHLLEDGFSLFIASLYFVDKKYYHCSIRILRKELKRQIMPDGAHFEQSPMYHCILLDRLLDCYNYSKSNPVFQKQDEINRLLYETAVRMLGHLESIVFADKSIPLVNDAAYEIAPTYNELTRYAKTLGINWKPIDLKECGYRVYRQHRVEAIIDIGDIYASYQPGHSHADTFNYELRIDGKQFIVDTGISTYEKNKRRQYERSTEAHNTVTFDNKNSSEIWGGFRVGDRATVRIIEDKPTKIAASHNGFGANHIHTRRFDFCNGGLEIFDAVSNGLNCVSYIHFAPSIEVSNVFEGIISTPLADINVEGAALIEIADCEVSTRYNVLQSAKVAKVHFNKELKCAILIR